MFDFSGFIGQKRESLRRAKQEARSKQESLKGLELLFGRYGVTRALVFGSVSRGVCRADSDIDLFVEGLAPENYWDLLREIEEHTHERVDLYCDRDNPIFTEKIKTRGWLIYEARHCSAQG